MKVILEILQKSVQKCQSKMNTKWIQNWRNTRCKMDIKWKKWIQHGYKIEKYGHKIRKKII